MNEKENLDFYSGHFHLTNGLTPTEGFRFSEYGFCFLKAIFASQS